MTDWKRIAARMRGDLDRAAINGRARRLAEFGIKATLMRGRTRVVIPNRADLCRLLKIGANHVAETVAELQAAAIIQVTELADGWELLVFPDATGWRVQWIYLRHEMDSFLSYLEQAPGQAQGELLEPEAGSTRGPSLARALAEVSAEAVGRTSNIQHPTSNIQKGSSQNGKLGVPEMGSRAVPLKEGVLRKALSFESSQLKAADAAGLKAGLYGIEGQDEGEAMAGVRQLLGERTYANDGGKWRNRWRLDRGRVHRVFAAMVEEMGRKPVLTPGGYAEWLWKQG